MEILQAWRVVRDVDGGGEGEGGECRLEALSYRAGKRLHETLVASFDERNPPLSGEHLPLILPVCRVELRWDCFRIESRQPLLVNAHCGMNVCMLIPVNYRSLMTFMSVVRVFHHRGFSSHWESGSMGRHEVYPGLWSLGLIAMCMLPWTSEYRSDLKAVQQRNGRPSGTRQI